MNPPPGSRPAFRLDAACSTLIGAYPVENWWPARSRFEVMVGAVLVQNTRWTNVAAAIRGLRSADRLTPHAIRRSRPADLASLIRSAGCQTIKAHRLGALASWVEVSGGLRRLASQETGVLRQALLGVHGIGPETADAILCFAFRRPTFIPDRYARRWLGRMGLLTADDLHQYDRCRQAVEGLLNGSSVDLRELHAAIVLHGQAVCGPTPDCADCLIRAQCHYRR